MHEAIMEHDGMINDGASDGSKAQLDATGRCRRISLLARYALVSPYARRLLLRFTQSCHALIRDTHRVFQPKFRASQFQVAFGWAMKGAFNGLASTTRRPGHFRATLTLAVPATLLSLAQELSST